MSEEQNDLQAPTAEMTAARLRLQKARLKAGKDPYDLCEFVYNSVSAYYDLENCDGELFCCISLGELGNLCGGLGIEVRNLFDDRPTAEEQIPSEKLLSKARNYIAQHKMSLDEFSDRIGFEFSPALQDAAKAMEWNVDFLRWICKELNVDWRSALPASHPKSVG